MLSIYTDKFIAKPSDPNILPFNKTFFKIIRQILQIDEFFSVKKLQYSSGAKANFLASFSFTPEFTACL